MINLPGRGEVFFRDSGSIATGPATASAAVLLLHGWTASADLNFFPAYTRDRLMRPAKQRALAGALRAQVIETAADHDLPLVNGAEYAELTRLAVDKAAAAAGLQPAG